MDEKSVKVTCDFCGKEIECPKDMIKKAKKHMCHECFQDRAENGNPEELKDVHVDYPTENLIEEFGFNQMHEEIFKENQRNCTKTFRRFSYRNIRVYTF